MTKDQIERIQAELEAELTQSVNADDPQAVKVKLERLTTYLGTSSKCQADAKRILLNTKREWLRQHVDRIKDFSPSVVKEYLATAAVDDEILFYRCEKNYSALVHGIDSMRSMLSILKAELNIS